MILSRKKSTRPDATQRGFSCRWVSVGVLIAVASGQNNIDPSRVTVSAPIEINPLPVVKDASPRYIPATMTLDCNSDFENRLVAWSAGKRDWCCQMRGVGCVALFDCAAGVDNAGNGWSLEKKSWCCKNRGVGCVDNDPVLATFGPHDCVTLSRSTKGTCVLTTRCSSVDTSNTEFAFVCLNPANSLPHALHSYGRGGFDEEEMFDTGVHCETCATVASAFYTGDDEVRKSLKSLPRDMLPFSAVPAYDVIRTEVVDSRAQIVQPATYVGESTGSTWLAQATYYGPHSCVTTFRSPTGTCIVQTKCVQEALAMFNVGITCVDKKGSYARYIFGRNTFAAEELFDTHMECERCFGVNDVEDPAAAMTTTLFVPKQTVQNINALTKEVLLLRQQLRDLTDSGCTSSSQGTNTSQNVSSAESTVSKKETVEAVAPSVAPSRTKETKTVVSKHHKKVVSSRKTSFVKTDGNAEQRQPLSTPAPTGQDQTPRAFAGRNRAYFHSDSEGDTPLIVHKRLGRRHPSDSPPP
eukprot:TRINITY_DN4918_c0_g1_i1.p1 TRINITY_DN4918_c0_g1~~TRINITY_DN4918_c0_g1_i1.p1  ORF type:complete len:524 (-),score=65.33 TRINITY_DN4918_c0_g1_i1:149-1720(-)